MRKSTLPIRDNKNVHINKVLIINKKKEHPLDQTMNFFLDFFEKCIYKEMGWLETKSTASNRKQTRTYLERILVYATGNRSECVWRGLLYWHDCKRVHIQTRKDSNVFEEGLMCKGGIKEYWCIRGMSNTSAAGRQWHAIYLNDKACNILECTWTKTQLAGLLRPRAVWLARQGTKPFGRLLNDQSNSFSFSGYRIQLFRQLEL